MSCWDRIDDKYIRPFLLYKYDRLKYRPEFEIEDVLNEYKIIEEEMNNITDENAEVTMKAMAFNNMSRKASRISNNDPNNPVGDPD